jgi:Arc/MetJ-type ribon-helix-helix transcriptional regulator
MAKVMVSLPDELLEKIDQEARRQDRSRSDLIPELLRKAFRQRPDPRSWRNAFARLRRLEKIWIGKWDSTQVIRSDRDRFEDRRRASR